jgi:hypothetical protein
VPLILHHLQNYAELLEVLSLRGYQWMFFEERNDDAHQRPSALLGEAPQRRLVIVSAPIHDQLPDTEVLPEKLQCGKRGRRLRDRELMLDLPTEPAHRIAHHADREAALPSTKPTTHCSNPGLSC